MPVLATTRCGAPFRIGAPSGPKRRLTFTPPASRMLGRTEGKQPEGNQTSGFIPPDLSLACSPPLPAAAPCTRAAAAVVATPASPGKPAPTAGDGGSGRTPPPVPPTDSAAGSGGGGGGGSGWAPVAFVMQHKSVLVFFGGVGSFVVGCITMYHKMLSWLDTRLSALESRFDTKLEKLREDMNRGFSMLAAQFSKVDDRLRSVEKSTR